MSDKPYKREQGDFELRILSDGRLVLIAPDETLLEIAQAFEVPADPDLPTPPSVHALLASHP